MSGPRQGQAKKPTRPDTDEEESGRQGPHFEKEVHRLGSGAVVGEPDAAGATGFRGVRGGLAKLIAAARTPVSIFEEELWTE